MRHDFSQTDKNAEVTIDDVIINNGKISYSMEDLFPNMGAHIEGSATIAAHDSMGEQYEIAAEFTANKNIFAEFEIDDLKVPVAPEVEGVVGVKSMISDGLDTWMAHHLKDILIPEGHGQTENLVWSNPRQMSNDIECGVYATVDPSGFSVSKEDPAIMVANKVHLEALPISETNKLVDYDKILSADIAVSYDIEAEDVSFDVRGNTSEFLRYLTNDYEFQNAMLNFIEPPALEFAKAQEQKHDIALVLDMIDNMSPDEQKDFYRQLQERNLGRGQDEPRRIEEDKDPRAAIKGIKERHNQEFTKETKKRDIDI